MPAAGPRPRPRAPRVLVEQLVTTRLGRARHADLMLGYLSAVALRWFFDDRRSHALGAHVDDIELLERCTCLADNRLRRFAVSVVELGERNDLLGQRQLKGRKGAGHLFPFNARARQLPPRIHPPRLPAGRTRHMQVRLNGVGQL